VAGSVLLREVRPAHVVRLTAVVRLLDVAPLARLDEVHGVENFWALLKRGLHGTYVQVADEHLHRYVDERAFTYNLRELTDLERFQTVLGRSIGRRLTWAELTN